MGLSEAAERPWKIGPREWEISDAYGELLASADQESVDYPTDVANARLIVTAVNAFEPMLEALKIAHAAIVGFNEDGTPRKGKQIMFTDEEREQIAEALKIAEGK